MKALTIQQPWAWAIAAGHKRVENRKIRASHRGPLAIHAGLKEDAEGLDFLIRLGLTVPTDIVFGAVIAVAELVDCIPFEPGSGLFPDPPLPTPEFAFGPWCYVLANVRPLVKPFPCRGQQGWFNVEIPAEHLERAA